LGFTASFILFAVIASKEVVEKEQELAGGMHKLVYACWF
jgi:hypothetical protein